MVVLGLGEACDGFFCGCGGMVRDLLGREDLFVTVVIFA